MLALLSVWSLIEACWLLLLVGIVRETVLEACLLIGHPSWLRVHVVQVAGRLRLLLLLFHRIPIPIDSALLLVALIVSSLLGYLGWCAVVE